MRWFTRLAYGGYLQDDFRASSKLAVNFGVRLEHEDGIREKNDRITVAFDQNAISPLNSRVSIPGRDAIRGGLVYAGVNGAPDVQGNQPAVAPRAGVVYSINEKTVMRGGYGLFWAPWNYPSPDNTNYGQLGFTGVSTLQQNTLVPITAIDSPFPTGLAQPVGSNLGLLAGVGGTIDYVDQNKEASQPVRAGQLLLGHRRDRGQQGHRPRVCLRLDRRSTQNRRRADRRSPVRIRETFPRQDRPGRSPGRRMDDFDGGDARERIPRRHPTIAEQLGSVRQHQRPNIVSGVPRVLVDDITAQLSENVANNQYLNPAGWSQAPAFTFGNAPRTDPDVRTPPRAKIDIAFAKRVKTGSRTEGEFRVELLNATGIPQYQAIPATFGIGTFGQVRLLAGYMRVTALTFRFRF